MKWSIIIAVTLVVGMGVFVGAVIYPSSELFSTTSSGIITGASYNSLISQINSSELDWRFEVVQLDELNVDIRVIDNKTFGVTPYSINETITSQGTYRWKARINYTIDGVNQEELLVGNLNKNQLDHEFEFDIPDGLTEFVLYIGENSTIIDASASNLATGFPESPNICRTSDGILNIAYEGESNDLYYANSSDGGVSWTSYEILGTTDVDGVGIICTVNDEIVVYYISPGDMDFMNSSDGGANWEGPNRILEGGGVTIHWGSCASNSVGETHCCGFDSSDNLWYGNTSVSDGKEGLEINGGDSDHCAVEFNSTDDLHLIVSDSAGDDIDHMAYVNGVWGSRTEVAGNLGTVDYNDENGLSLAIDQNDILHIASIHSDDLQYCYGIPGTWACQELDGGNSFNPVISVSENGLINILYQSATSNSDLLLANSSDSLTWQVRQTLYDSDWPSVINSKFPSWNNILDTLQYLVTNSSVVTYDEFAIDYTEGFYCTPYESPSATGDDYDEWAAPENLYVSDNSRGYSEFGGAEQDYYNFNFTIPDDSTIAGIFVALEGNDAFEDEGADVGIELSPDGGSTYTSTGYENEYPDNNDIINTYGNNLTDSWGRTWSQSEFSDENFRVKIEDTGNDGLPDMDHLQVKVCYINIGTPPEDTCTCPGLNEDWEIDHGDACVITDNCDLGTGTLTFTGTGTTTCDAVIDTSDMGDTGVGGKLLIQDDCIINGA